jgi:hypothetical protein
VGRILRNELAYGTVSQHREERSAQSIHEDERQSRQSRDLLPGPRHQRRLSQRDRVDADGVIWLEGRSRVKCLVRDLSRFGVGLVLHATVSLPAEFDLTFDRVTRRYVTVWRWYNRMGVKLKGARLLSDADENRTTA